MAKKKYTFTEADFERDAALADRFQVGQEIEGDEAEVFINAEKDRADSEDARRAGLSQEDRDEEDRLNAMSPEDRAAEVERIQKEKDEATQAQTSSAPAQNTEHQEGDGQFDGKVDVAPTGKLTAGGNRIVILADKEGQYVEAEITEFNRADLNEEKDIIIGDHFYYPYEVESEEAAS